MTRILSAAAILLWSCATAASVERKLAAIPQYVLDYAPVVHLFSEENYWPCDIAEHLEHTTPYGNYTELGSETKNLTLDELDQLNDYDRGRTVFLKSNDDPESHPDWLGGAKNKPENPDDGDGESEWSECGDGEFVTGSEDWIEAPNTNDRTEVPQRDGDGNKHQKKHFTGGRSSPVTLVTVEKGNGIVDAFWFFFYSFNLGNTVLNIRFGNHVGDWEHTLVRFQHGKPKAIFLSQHDGGDAYSYAAIEKIGRRPVVFSATGTHAMYGTPGVHAYAIPLGLLHDVTDRGPLWDPILNFYSYGYNLSTRSFEVGDATPDIPLAWINYNGKWGDKMYPLGDSRQYGLAGQYHYVSGPLGPKFKDLNRKKICQGRRECIIRNWLPPSFELVEHEYRTEEQPPEDYDELVRDGERSRREEQETERIEL